MPEHRDIVDAQLHQPKGASTALEGQLLRALGDGTTEWKYPPQGWGYYKHGGADQVFNTTFSKLIIDGAGGSTETNYLPRQIRGSNNLWDTVSNKIKPVTLGDSYELRIDIPIISETGTPVDITTQLDIGNGTSPSIVIVERFSSAGKATPYTLSVGFPIFCGATFLANGGQIFMKTNSGTVTASGAAIHLVRLSGGDW